MQALFALTLANIRSYVRDRAALFWTLAFPLVFIVMFGLIFQGGGGPSLTLAFVDDDGGAGSTALHELFTSQTGVSLVDTTQADAIDQMKLGKVDAIIVVPDGYSEGLIASAAGPARAVPGHGLHGPERASSSRARSTRWSGACSAS